MGYSEIPLQEFADQKVQRATLVRVVVEKDHYFNFDFSDSSQWECYRILKDTDDPVLFGYLSADSPLREKLASAANKKATFILKIQYPENLRSDNQVLIVDVVYEGWVIGI